MKVRGVGCIHHDRQSAFVRECDDGRQLTDDTEIVRRGDEDAVDRLAREQVVHGGPRRSE